MFSGTGKKKSGRNADFIRPQRTEFAAFALVGVGLSGVNMPEGSWSLSMLRFSDVCWSDLIIEDLLYFRVRARGDGKLKKVKISF